MDKIVIIGLGSAGYAALMEIKKINRKADITIIDPKPYDLVHPCGLPYTLEGVVKRSDLFQNLNLQKIGVEKINGIAKLISTKDKFVLISSNGKEEKIDFDKLIIATGNKPFLPDIDGLGSVFNNRIYTLASIKDLDNISLKIKNSKKGIVIGAGAIGLEAAIALKKYISTVTVIEGESGVLPGILDPDFSKIVEDYLIESGIEIVTNRFVESLIGDNQFQGVKISEKVIDADLGILATGFKADTSLAKVSGLEINNNGIVVDKFLKSSADNIFAAGDCISGYSKIDSTLLKAKLATSAYKQGVVAGLNVLDGKKEYKGSTGTFVSKIGGLEIAGTGYTFEGAKSAGFSPVIGKIKSEILPEYFPGNSSISLKVIADKTSGKILGAQAIGLKGAAERINIFSFAIEFDISIYDIKSLELAYCPAVSEVYDPLLKAVDFCIRRVK